MQVTLEEASVRLDELIRDAQRLSTESCTMIRSSHVAFICVATATCSIVSCVAARGNASPVQNSGVLMDSSRIQFPETNRHNFYEMLNAISEQARIAIFIEGQPLHPDLTDDEIRALNPALSGKALTVNDALALLSEKYDYSVERKFNNVILLKKRYSDPADLPCVTYEEIVHFLREIKSVTGGDAASTGTNAAVIEKLFNSLTPEQLAQAKDAIAISSLNDEQRQMVLGLARNLLLKDKVTWTDRELRHLQLLDDPHTTFCWMSVGGVEAFGYQGPFSPKNTIWPFPLSDRFLNQIGGGTTQVRVSSSPNETAPDPTIPTEEDKRLASGMIFDKAAPTRTLGSVIKSSTAVSKSSKTSTKSGSIKINYDDAIGDKPVTIIGQKYIKEDILLQSLASLYGLSLLIGKDNQYILTLPHEHGNIGLAGIPDEIRRLTPDPLVRALFRQIGVTAKALGNSAKYANRKSDSLSEDAKQAHERLLNHQALPKATNQYYFPCVRRVRVIAQPLVPTPQSPPVPVSTAGKEGKRLIALATLSGPVTMALYDLINLNMQQGMSLLEVKDIKLLVLPRDNSKMVQFGELGNDGIFRTRTSITVGISK